MKMNEDDNDTNTVIATDGTQANKKTVNCIDCERYMNGCRIVAAVDLKCGCFKPKINKHISTKDKEKAIKILQWLHDNTFLFQSTEKEVKFATDIAIKLLQLPSVAVPTEEYIRKDTAIDDITTGLCEGVACSECPFDEPDIICKVRHWLKDMPTVAIPTEHDGCKDCKHEIKSDGEYHCSYCKQNYKDMWERKTHPHWIWKKENIYQCSECKHEVYVKQVMGEPQYAWCPMCGCPMEIER